MIIYYKPHKYRQLLTGTVSYLCNPKKCTPNKHKAMATQTTHAEIK